MKKEMKNILALISLILLLNCNKNDDAVNHEIINPTNSIAFEIEQINPNFEHFKYAISEDDIELSSIKESFIIKEDGFVRLVKEFDFDIALDNDNNITLSFFLLKDNVKQDLLLLEEFASSTENSRIWNYKSTYEEITDFYMGLDIEVVTFNLNHVLTKDSEEFLNSNNNFEFEGEFAKVQGEEKTYVTIYFDGKAVGWYDSFGEHQEVYKITNGVFKGVIE